MSMACKYLAFKADKSGVSCHAIFMGTQVKDEQCPKQRDPYTITPYCWRYNTLNSATQPYDSSGCKKDKW